MSSQGASDKRYEEFAYGLDIKRHTRSTAVRGRSGDILFVLGQRFLNLLEVLIEDDATFETGSVISIGTKDRVNILSVLGKVPYAKLTQVAKDAVPDVIDTLVADTEERFVRYVNRAGPVNQRTSSLEMLPGVGKKLVEIISRERENKPFESFEDISERTGFTDIASSIAKRIGEELAGETRMNIFVRR